MLALLVKREGEGDCKLLMTDKFCWSTHKFLGEGGNTALWWLLPVWWLWTLWLVQYQAVSGLWVGRQGCEGARRAGSQAKETEVSAKSKRQLNACSLASLAVLWEIKTRRRFTLMKMEDCAEFVVSLLLSPSNDEREEESTSFIRSNHYRVWPLHSNLRQNYSTPVISQLWPLQIMFTIQTRLADMVVRTSIIHSLASSSAAPQTKLSELNPTKPNQTWPNTSLPLMHRLTTAYDINQGSGLTV